MDLGIKGKHYVVCGATSGFGYAVTQLLIEEGATVCGISRTQEMLDGLKDRFAGQFSYIQADLTLSGEIDRIIPPILEEKPQGVLVNAGGPPAKPFHETCLADWDQAYNQLLRWKVDLIQRMLPFFLQQGNGRFVFVESSAIKQPVENLVLSTSCRLAVAGLVKSLSQEYASTGVTFNILAPGYHQTPAIDRLVLKRSEQKRISIEEAYRGIEAGIPVKKMGNPADFATLSAWLLSPRSSYVTGQVYGVDGGQVVGVL